MSQGDNGSFKHVSVNQFNQFIQDRMNSNGGSLKSKSSEQPGSMDKSTSLSSADGLMPPPANRPPR
jgi:hypothetical protein